MELFPAADLDQFEFIKRVIDDCDYYVLIIGARYGSMDVNGVSYTEKEYDYAVSKDIPIMAFLHKDIAAVPIGKADTEESLRKKLEAFRKKVETGRLVKYWSNADELDALVAKSLPKTIKMFPRTGWVRANLQTSAEALHEINLLRKEISQLKAFKEKYIKEHNYVEDIADWDESFSVHYTSISGNAKKKSGTISNTWREWFRIFALELDSDGSTFGYSNVFNYVLERAIKIHYTKKAIEVAPADREKVKYQFMGYNVIGINKTGIVPDCFLTEKGKNLLIQLMSVKTQKQKNNIISA
jgi:hypothetical protein